MALLLPVLADGHAPPPQGLNATDDLYKVKASAHAHARPRACIMAAIHTRLLAVVADGHAYLPGGLHTANDLREVTST